MCSCSCHRYFATSTVSHGSDVIRSIYRTSLTDKVQAKVQSSKGKKDSNKAEHLPTKRRDLSIRSRLTEYNAYAYLCKTKIVSGTFYSMQCNAFPIIPKSRKSTLRLLCQTIQSMQNTHQDRPFIHRATDKSTNPRITEVPPNSCAHK